jgi:hypothetical protein
MMIPSRWTYGLLIGGMAIAVILAVLIRLDVAIALMLLFDLVVLLLAWIDSRRVQQVQVQRQFGESERAGEASGGDYDLRSLSNAISGFDNAFSCKTEGE